MLLTLLLLLLLLFFGGGGIVCRVHRHSDRMACSNRTRRTSTDEYSQPKAADPRKMASATLVQPQTTPGRMCGGAGTIHKSSQNTSPKHFQLNTQTTR